MKKKVFELQGPYFRKEKNEEGKQTTVLYRKGEELSDLSLAEQQCLGKKIRLIEVIEEAEMEIEVEGEIEVPVIRRRTQAPDEPEFPEPEEEESPEEEEEKPKGVAIKLDHGWYLLPNGKKCRKKDIPPEFKKKKD